MLSKAISSLLFFSEAQINDMYRLKDMSIMISFNIYRVIGRSKRKEILNTSKITSGEI